MMNDAAYSGPGETISGAASSRQETPVAADTVQSEEEYDTGMIRRGVVNIPAVGVYRKRIGAEHRGLLKLVVSESAGKYRHFDQCT